MGDDGLLKGLRPSLIEKSPNALAPPMSRQRSVSSERSPTRTLDPVDDHRRARSISNSPLPPCILTGLPSPATSRQRAATGVTPKRRERRRSLGHGGLLQFQEQLRRRRKSLEGGEGSVAVAYTPARTLHTKVFMPHRKSDGTYQPVTDTALRAQQFLGLLSEEKGSANVMLLGMHTELLSEHPEGGINDCANESLIQLQHGLLKCIRIWFEVSGDEVPRRNSTSGSGKRASLSGSDREEEFGVMPEPDSREESKQWQGMKSPRRPRSQTSTPRYVEEEFSLPTREASMSDGYAYAPQRYEPPVRRTTLTAAPDEETARKMNQEGELELAFPRLGREISDRTKMIGSQIMRDDYIQLHAEKQKLKDMLRRQKITTEEYRRRDRDVAQNFQRSYAGTLGAVRGQLEQMKLILREKEPGADNTQA